MQLLSGLLNDLAWRWTEKKIISQERRNMGTKICMCFEVKVLHGAYVLIIASVFWFQIIQS